MTTAFKKFLFKKKLDKIIYTTNFEEQLFITF